VKVIGFNIGKATFGIGLGALGFAALAGYAALKEYPIYSQVQGEAQTIALDQLLTKGWGDNRHMVLTGFKAGNHVYQGKDDKWEAVWIPLVPKSDREGVVHPCLLLVSDQIASPEELDEILRAEVVEGVVQARRPFEDRVFGIPNIDAQRLEKENLSMDIANCIYLRHNANVSKIWLFGRLDLSAAIVSLLAGFAMTAIGWRVWQRSRLHAPPSGIGHRGSG
jgi:hypothetical protein